MARYIDADKLIAEIEENINTYLNEGIGGYHLAEDVLNYSVKTAPASDVAPKSEVERLTVELDSMRGAANTYKMHYENARKEIERLKDYNTGVAFKHYFDGRKEVAREIFEEIYKTMNSVYASVQHSCVGMHGDNPETMRLLGKLDGVKHLGDEIAELKKKYTEEYI